MLYLSAQPDDYYFLWQLQLQLFNFSRLGIEQSKVHVLIGYHPAKGLADHFKQFIKKNKQAIFFAYPDTREEKEYESSLRPHIISKHLKANPLLERKTLFYHDSDIIFSRLPDFEKLKNDQIWYASNTESYTSARHIKRMAGEFVFEKMCAVVKVSKSLVEQNDAHAGGAQYLLKNTSVNFWEKLEKDSERMYVFLRSHNSTYGSAYKAEGPIQAWCADIWCLWWQALSIGKTAKIHPEFDFSWADTKLTNQREKPIIHYTGQISIENKSLFRKNNYYNCSPFFDDFDSIDKTSSSYHVVEEIRRYNDQQLRKRRILKDFTLIISVVNASADPEAVYTVLKYINKNFKLNIALIEIGEVSVLDDKLFTMGVLHHTVLIENAVSLINDIVRNSSSQFFCFQPGHLIIPVKQVQKSIEYIKLSNSPILACQKCLEVDPLIGMMFSKLLSVELLQQNHGKMGDVDRQLLTGNCGLFFRKDTSLKFEVLKGNEDVSVTWFSDGTIAEIPRLDGYGYYFDV